MGDMARWPGYKRAASDGARRRVSGAPACGSGDEESPFGPGSVGALVRLAEDRGFEPLRAFTQHAFQACAIGH